ncbi:MAG TPA: hypothetical protein VNY04_10450 [Chthoniobacterales bacterium]|nr:hypothetical protein [Chthoniobacterales bacterium]
MKMHCLLVGIIGTGLLMLTPDAVAHGGAGGGTGHGFLIKFPGPLTHTW